MVSHHGEQHSNSASNILSLWRLGEMGPHHTARRHLRTPYLCDGETTSGSGLGRCPTSLGRVGHISTEGCTGSRDPPAFRNLWTARERGRTTTSGAFGLGARSAPCTTPEVPRDADLPTPTIGRQCDYPLPQDGPAKVVAPPRDISDASRSLWADITGCAVSRCFRQIEGTWRSNRSPWTAQLEACVRGAIGV
jgi:hypothetical protein